MNRRFEFLHPRPAKGLAGKRIAEPGRTPALAMGPNPGLQAGSCDRVSWPLAETRT
jgi:hypothetical protein